MKHVLLVTERYDPTADLIIAELRRRELPCVRWNLDQFPVGSVLSYAASNERFAAHIIVDGRRLDLADVASICWRGFQPTWSPDNLLRRATEICDYGISLGVDGAHAGGQFSMDQSSGARAHWLIQTGPIVRSSRGWV